MVDQVSGRALREAAGGSSTPSPAVSAKGAHQPRERRTIALHHYQNGRWGEQTLGLVRVRSPYLDGYVIEHWDRVFYPNAPQAKAGFRSLAAHLGSAMNVRWVK